MADPLVSTTTSSGQSGPVDWMNGNWQNYINRVNGMTGQPLPVYGGPTVAPLNPYQNTAGDMSYQFATNGSAAGNAAANTATNFAQTGGGFNPYAGMQNPYAGLVNPMYGQTNPYAGDNPYLQQQIDASNADITKAYSQGTAAQTDAAFNQAGAYGGSAYQGQVANNQDMLGKTLAANTNNYRYNNYLNSGQLANSDLSRNAGLAQFDQGLNAQLGENSINRLNSAYNTQNQNMLAGGQLGLQTEPLDMAAINQLSQQGGIQQGNTQNNLNAMQNYFNQSTMAPYASLDILRNAYGAVPGQSTSGTSTTTQNAGQLSPWANIIGGLGVGASLFPGLFDFFSGGS